MKIGFIGTGNMGSALARAVSVNENVEILLANRTKSKAIKLAKEIGGKVVDNKQICKQAELIFLGVKPQQTKEVLEDLKVIIENNKKAILVSMVAGWGIDRINEIVNVPIIRIMPNTPVLVNEGVILYAYNPKVDDSSIKDFCGLLSNVGKLIEIKDELIDAASSVSGCGPAFVDIFAESLADGAVACGVPRKIAQALAAQMILGSGKLLRDSDKNASQLKDEVCSPGGSTIEGVRTLEENRFRAAVIDAIIASYNKNRKL